MKNTNLVEPDNKSEEEKIREKLRNEKWVRQNVYFTLVKALDLFGVAMELQKMNEEEYNPDRTSQIETIVSSSIELIKRATEEVKPDVFVLESLAHLDKRVVHPQA